MAFASWDRLAWFAPAGEEQARPPFPPTVRTEFRPQVKGASRDLQVLTDAGWITAAIEGATSDWRIRRGES